MAHGSPLPALAGVSHRDVVAGGVRLHVAEAGAGPPFLLLHGWPQHWWSWRRVIGPLAEHHRVLAPDLRGFGWSEAPRDAYAKATLAADVLALLEAEGLDRVAVVGHDWGGYVGFLMALEHPELVTRLVALDIAPPWRAAPQLRHVALPAVAAYQVLLATPGLGPGALTAGPHLVRTLIRAGSGRRASWTTAELDTYADVLRDPARAEASSALYRTFLTRELPATLRHGARSANLRVPVLLLMGGASPVRRVLNPHPGGRLEVRTIPGAGHFLAEEAPEAVLGHVVPFLAQTG